MAQKTFKIGEYALGGIIQVRIVDTIVGINVIDWKTKKVIANVTFQTRNFSGYDYREIDNFLNDVTTSYFAGKVLDWIKKVIQAYPPDLVLNYHGK